MKKRYLKVLIIALMASGLCSNAQENKDCNSVQIGTFKLISDEIPEYIIVRTEKHQTEEIKEYNHKVQFDITWVDSCTYELSNKKVISGKQMFESKKDDVLTVEILEVRGKSVFVKCSSNFADLVTEVEMETILKN